MATDDFFEQQREQSEVKAAIVEKYFNTWASIVGGSARSDIAYVDLFAGPGRYEDGAMSTPIRGPKKGSGLKETTRIASSCLGGQGNHP